MTDKEVKELLEELELKPENLPKILESDPQVKILNGKVGQIVKIDRTENGVKVPYYRIIVEG
jgi:DNA-directed RNA polymerase subunit H (RpoH/RPB5)